VVAAQARGAARRWQVGARLVRGAPLPVRAAGPVPVRLGDRDAAGVVRLALPGGVPPQTALRRKPDRPAACRAVRAAQRRAAGLVAGTGAAGTAERSRRAPAAAGGSRAGRKHLRDARGRTARTAAALYQRQDRAPVSAAGARAVPAVGRQARPGHAADRQRPAVGVAVGRWPAGAQAMNRLYLETARLLTQIAPLVFADETFALKGGTAINLFARDMPRLSVDLDLVFPDYTLPRDQALARIGEALRQAEARLIARGFTTHVPGASGAGTKLLVRRGDIEVKIEVNFVLRGTVRPVQRASLTPKARETLLADLEIPVVSLEDMYGGKLVAALDRQHPRDLFDVMGLFANEGITPGIRRAFVVYLASHNRPIHEVLFPSLRDVQGDYTHGF